MTGLFKDLLTRFYGKLSGDNISILESDLENIVKPNKYKALQHLNDIKATMDGEDNWFIAVHRVKKEKDVIKGFINDDGECICNDIKD